MGDGTHSSAVETADALLALPADAGLLRAWSGVRSSTEAFGVLQSLVLQLIRERPTLANHVVEHALASESIDDAVDRLRLIRLHAHTAKATGDLPASLERYAQAFEGLRSIDDPVEAARTVIGWSDALALAGDSRAAQERIHQARALLGRRDPVAAVRLEGSAATVHYLAGEYDQAEALYRRARDRARRRHQPVDAAVCTFNLANVDLLRGQASRARRGYRRAHDVFAAQGLELAALQCRYGIAACELHRGSWPDAIAELDRVAEQIRERGDRRGAAAIDHEAAELLTSLGADPVAEVHARRARADFTAMGLGPERARAAALHGRILAHMGRGHDALRRVDEAATAFESMGRDDVVERLTLERAHVDLGRGRIPDDTALDTIVRRATRRGDRTTATRARTLRAETALRGGRTGSALRLARRAHDDAARPPLTGLRPRLALLVARAHAAAGRGDDAVRWARKAVRAQERLAARVGDQAESLGVGHARDRIAGDAVDIVLEHGGSDAPRQALRLLMSLREGSVFADLLRGRHHSVREDLRAALARVRDRLMESGGTADDVRSVALGHEVHRLERRLRLQKDPAPPSAVWTPRHGTPRTWIDRTGGRPLVIYDRTDQRWGAFVVERGGRTRYVDLPDAGTALREHWIPLRMLFEALARTPARARDRLLGRTVDEARAGLTGVTDALWTPLALDASEVVVVSTGAMNGVGLEAALLETLGRDAPVLARVPHPELLVVGDRPRRPRALLVEGTVPGARREIEEIESRLQRSGWKVDVARSRAEFLATRTTYGLVHLATHGSFHRHRWVSNGLQLPDGWLGFEQLDPRRVRDALLVFDSCESGLQNEAPGAELDGWASAGFAAGARDIVLHQWKIDDASATRFMGAFYGEVLDAASIAHAVHRARRTVREATPHPFAWASTFLSSRTPFAGNGS
ncbi:MAG TPA: CHAT domain-containing protein [Candidatus Krumholzibacteria bacterium]|nr:CHAT domain-containing protein [Candidatus Krumholzibacteria bacterium]